MQNSGIRVSNLSFIVDGIPFGTRDEICWKPPRNNFEVGSKLLLGAHSRYQALFVLAIR